MPFNNPFLSYSLCLWCNLLEVLKLSLYFTCNLMWYICVTFRPIKRKVMSSSCFMFPLPLCQSIMEFFYGFLGMFHVGLIHLEASIGWYLFHLTKYSRFCFLNYLDLSMASTSNFGSLWTKFGGGLELCFRLGFEARRAIGFKNKTWNTGWTFRFSDSFNL